MVVRDVPCELARCLRDLERVSDRIRALKHGSIKPKGEQVTKRPPIIDTKRLPVELLREIENAHQGFAGRLAQLFSEHTRAAYQVGYENGWTAGWAAADADRGEDIQ